MVSYRYTGGAGGSQTAAIPQHELMDELSEYLLSQGDVQSALRQMMQKGLKDHSVPGLQEMLQQLRQKRQEALDKKQLSSVVQDLQEKLQDVVDTERGGIKDQVEAARARAELAEALRQALESQRQRHEGQPQSSELDQAQADAEALERAREFLQAMAQEKQDFLDQLPSEMGKAVQQLAQNYEFMDEDAERKFDELMQELRDQMSQNTQPMNQGREQMNQSLADQMRQMLDELKQMMQQQQQGGGDQQQQWQDFQDRHQQQMGSGSGDQSMQDFMQQMQQQQRMLQNLMESLNAENRRQLQDLMESMMQEMGLQDSMQELQQALNQMFPPERPQRYSFRGDEHMDMNEAMDLMRQLSDMEDLERQLRRAQYGDGIEDIDPETVRQLLGDEAADALELLKNLAQELEDAGYIRHNGDKLELTPQGMRKIGQKALKDIFDRLKESRQGRHETERRGAGIDRLDETKLYEFGDPFYLDLQRTVRNAVYRSGHGVPVSLAPQDFEVYRTELQTESTTVLMLDLSWSMARRGSFYAAKKVILALHSLIKTQFPRDSIYIVGFSTYARELKAEQLPYITWDQAEPYTNMQQGFMISQKLLAKHKTGTKQILMISDGEPTAHIERGQIFLGYPPSPRTITETLREVRHCTRDGIIINTFMLDRSYYLREFVDQLTKINRGRAFYTSPDTLGQYVMVDYLRQKRSRIA